MKTTTVFTVIDAINKLYVSSILSKITISGCVKHANNLEKWRCSRKWVTFYKYISSL